MSRYFGQSHHIHHWSCHSKLWGSHFHVGLQSRKSCSLLRWIHIRYRLLSICFILMQKLRWLWKVSIVLNYYEIHAWHSSTLWWSINNHNIMTTGAPVIKIVLSLENALLLATTLKRLMLLKELTIFAPLKESIIKPTAVCYSLLKLRLILSFWQFIYKMWFQVHNIDHYAMFLNYRTSGAITSSHWFITTANNRIINHYIRWGRWIFIW